MRWLTILLLLASASVFAANGTITADTSGSVEKTVLLTYGCGTLRLGSAASADFGSGGTVSLLELLEDNTWATVDTYLVVTEPAITLDFQGVPTYVGVSMASSTTPDLYWQITNGIACGG